MSDLRSIWGRRVAAAREAAGLTQFELAVKIGASPSAISQIERGERSPRDSLRLRIAKGLDVPVNVLFAYPDDVVTS